MIPFSVTAVVGNFYGEGRQYEGDRVRAEDGKACRTKGPDYPWNSKLGHSYGLLRGSYLPSPNITGDSLRLFSPGRSPGTVKIPAGFNKNIP